MKEVNRLYNGFENPDKTYRSAPFWAWNDELDQEELKNQVSSMKEQGMSGFFMHSREGLLTEYMGDEWMKCIKETVAFSKEIGMEAWLYDEDRWPSGTAGGKIASIGGDVSRCKGLTLEVSREFPEDYNDLLAAFKAKVKDMNLSALERFYPSGKTAVIPKLCENEAYLLFRLEVSEKSEWFNDEAPPDNLSAESVRIFINETHEKYKDAVGSEFGKTIPGIFADEPSLHDRHARFNPKRGWIPWTYGFEEYFEKRRGYDVLDVSPFIFFNCEESFSARHDYWQTITEMFSETFSKQISEWCEKNNLLFCGHFLQEDKLGLATRVSGAVMPHYRYQQVPGIDILQEKTDEYLTVKQCTSVANQYGRKVVLSETYGCTGWEFSFEGQKWIGDWQYALGVSKRCQHLALYSLKGCRKRDYPPVFNYNTTWWEYNHVLEDYFARLGYILSQGNVVRDILIIHPSSTAWGKLGVNPYGNPSRRDERDVRAIDEMGYEFNDFLKYMSGGFGRGFDYDLGDETIIEEGGYADGKQFAVNLARYKLVIIPHVETLLKSTYAVLLKFLDNGGKVIAVKPLFNRISGKVSDVSKLLFHNGLVTVEIYKEVVCALEKLLQRQISITTTNCSDECSKDKNENILCMHRTISKENTDILFLVNNDRKKTHEVNISATGSIVEEWDLLSGSRHILFESESDRIDVTFELKEADSKLLVILKSSQDFGLSSGLNPKHCLMKLKDMQKTEEALVLADDTAFCFRRDMDNLLTLDTVRYSLFDENFSDEQYVWQAQREIRDRLKMQQIHHNGLQQRYKWVKALHQNDNVKLSLLFTFHVDNPYLKEVNLIIEEPQNFSCMFNGQAVEMRPTGYYLDKTFKKIRLKDIVVGENRILLSCLYINKMELEDCYISGDFAVNFDRKIIEEPSKLKIGDWCLQGYPHYSGSMTYLFESVIEPKNSLAYFMKISSFSATVMEIFVNDKSAGIIPWKAKNRVDITQNLRKGLNAFAVKVVSSPRNMLGPFHFIARPNVINDGAFRIEGDNYSNTYKVQPYGLTGEIEIYGV